MKIIVPHMVSSGGWLGGLWWRLRGVNTSADWAGICRRCGHTGRAHWGWVGCWRFLR